MIEQNLDAFFSLNEFAVNAVYKFRNGEEKEIVVIYDNDYISSTMEGIIIENANPRVFVKTSDVENAKVGDVLVVNGIEYNVINVKPDGTGITIVDLSINELDEQ